MRCAGGEAPDEAVRQHGETAVPPGERAGHQDRAVHEQQGRRGGQAGQPVRLRRTGETAVMDR